MAARAAPTAPTARTPEAPALLERLFKLRENSTTVSTEVIGGITTFFVMAYIIALNPIILNYVGNTALQGKSLGPGFPQTVAMTALCASPSFTVNRRSEPPRTRATPCSDKPTQRSEERRVGKECPQLCRSRWSPISSFSARRRCRGRPPWASSLWKASSSRCSF